MNLFDAITTRRTIKEFTAQPVPDDLLHQALDAGRWAQNHRMTEPWRFFILGPQSQQAVAAINGDALLEKARADAETLAKMRAEAETKILSKPRIVAVTCSLCGNKEVEQEDYAAVSCAIQNIQLAAWGLGLGMQWSTSGFTTRPATYALLGVDPAQEMIAGLLYFGYPAAVPAAKARKSLAEVTKTLP
ncbi:MAG: nitroreductase [Caldilineaceae bacterium]|nr:nitroreductase [Caldilineaceae bacterium]HRJ42233.1 nitroreductase [Caldilineaceae bacterium]